MEIKDNFNPIQTNDNHIYVANEMSTQTSTHSFKDPSQVNPLAERLPEVGLYDNMTEQMGESKTKRQLTNENKEWLGRLPLIKTPTIRNLVKQPISPTRNGQLQNQAERQYRPNKTNEQLQKNYFRNRQRFRNRPPQAQNRQNKSCPGHQIKAANSTNLPWFRYRMQRKGSESNG
ncbi:Hypothetical predicted protein [Paramuricea clavata]|uniref:Uncharacterized protein n=1 Tax=Paramuricea clavata TaxID=317549 RepID=A0A6S7JJ24_PARCT|nr:Hypothetical predicted protein [Paramuricea clavata]